jgi:hypothetical protein
MCLYTTGIKYKYGVNVAPFERVHKDNFAVI